MPIDPVTGAIIASTAGNVIGGLMGRDAQSSANAANERIAERNYGMQKEFAQMGIRWKVDDAKAAGISPLAALGAQTHSFAPSAIGVQADNSMGNAMAQMGQDISRAVVSQQTADEREMRNLQLASLKLDLQGKEIDNAIRASTLAKTSATQIGPPTPRLGNKGVPSPSNPARDAGQITSYAFMKQDDGGLGVVPSEAAKERTEDDLPQQLNWAIRNQILPYAKGLTPPNPKEFPLPSGYNLWEWNPVKQAFYPAKRSWSDDFDDIWFGSHPPRKKGGK